MCPLWPFHFVIIYLLLFVSLFYFVIGAASVSSKLLNVKFEEYVKLNLHMSEVVPVQFSISDNGQEIQSRIIRVISDNPDIATCTPNEIKLPYGVSDYSAYFNVTANYIGRANVKLQTEENSQILESDSLPVTVTRAKRTIDTVFSISVIILVSIIFINFGCALNLQAVKENFAKPIGPIIGLICQLIFMPLIGFAAGRLIFPESVAMQLGLFFTGVSPSGGASNIWIYALGGNLSLSISITAISNICAFLTIPLWTFTLGRIIFDEGYLVVPYTKIASYAVSLMVPLLIGLGLQKKCPKFSQIMVRILKPFSSCLILFIIVFATVTNLYLFKLFTWKILTAGMCLPLAGYLISWLIASGFNRPYKDCLAISIETGVQNTGIAIFMLRFALGQPEADLTTVVPVAVALMTPIPILVLFVIHKYCSCMDAVKAEEKNGSVITYPVDDKIADVSLMNQMSPE